MVTNIIIVTMLAQLLPASPTPAEVDEPPIRFSFVQNSLIVVPVFINESGPYRFLLDTGATTSILSIDVASRLNIRTIRNQTLMTPGGLATAATGSVDSVRIGAVRVVQTQIAIVNAGFLRILHVDGLLGTDYLKQFRISIDYASGTVILKR
jgi:predicted aspartyl protease